MAPCECFPPTDDRIVELNKFRYSLDPEADWGKINPGNVSGEIGEQNNLYGCMKQLYSLKKSHRQLKVMLSIGGWLGSQSFAIGVNTAAKREEFARSSAAMVGDLGFDGLDIDWEYPTNGTEFVDLLSNIRSALETYSSLHQSNYHFQLSIAASAGKQHYEFLPWKDISTYVDHINIMAYDYAGATISSVSAHFTNLYPDNENPATTPYSTDSAVQGYLQAGVEPAKIILGIPLFGRGFDQTDGLGKPFVAQSTGDFGELGTWDYKSLPQPGSVLNTVAEVNGAYSYDSSKRSLVSFDIPDTVAGKMQYIKNENLGGAMFWQCSGDKKGDQSLIGVSNKLLDLDSTPNCLVYPASRFENLRTGSLLKNQ